jgi:amino acid permease
VTTLSPFQKLFCTSLLGIPALILARFETNSVVGLYFGRRWEIAYTICIVLFIFSGLWAYATVFANSMMTFVPFPGLSAGMRPTSTNSTLATVRR